MPRSRISLETKQRIVDAHNDGEDYVAMARVLGVARGTAWSIIRRHIEFGQVARRRGGAHNQKMDDDMVQMCVTIVEAHPEYTLTQINRELRAELPDKPQVCGSTISKSASCFMVN